ncbi:MAG: hypothetical protein LAT82_06020 [Nanoarchaeota archaeon]|nr:hypothetical protein [Nanoarchaeota archaeon]
MYRVFIFPTFKEKIKKLFSKQEIVEIENFIENQLKIKGEYIGKPLNSTHLREKKIKGKRIYYLIYKEIAVILLVNASNKKCETIKDS